MCAWLRLCGAAFVTDAVTLAAVLQIPQVSDLMRERASLTQGYDEGPEGRFGGQQKAIRLDSSKIRSASAHSHSVTIHHHEEVHNVYLTQFHNAGWIGGLLFIATIAADVPAGTIRLVAAGRAAGRFRRGNGLVLPVSIVEGLVIDSDHWRHLFIVLALIWGLSDAHKRATTACGVETTALR